MLSGAALIIYQGSDLLEELRIEGITYADLPPSILSVYEPTEFPITKQNFDWWRGLSIRCSGKAS